MLDLTWNQPLTNTDGTVFDASQFNGYEIAIDGTPAVSIPVAWSTNGVYAFSWNQTFSDGQHTGQIRVKHKSGTVSAYSNTATFTVSRVPDAPVNFTIA